MPTTTCLPGPMPDPVGGARRRIQHGWQLLVETFKRFDSDGVPRLAAAMSYFLLLAVAPLLLILNGVLGVVGVRLGMGSVPAIEDAGATAATGIQQAVAWAGSYAPVRRAGAGRRRWCERVRAVHRSARGHLGHAPAADAAQGLLPVPRAVACAVAPRRSGADRRAHRVCGGDGLRQPRLRASAEPRVFHFQASGSSSPSQSRRSGSPRRRCSGSRSPSLPTGAIHWRDSLFGALVTSVLFLVGEVVLSLYLRSSERFNVFGTFQFFVVLIVWIYYSALVALWGAELTRLLILEAEERREDRESLGTPAPSTR